LLNIENVTGSGADDTITGNAVANVLLGGVGNDTLAGGLGNDTLDGGANNDTADYSASAAAATVNLGLGTATGEGSDTLQSLENVIGSALDDTLTGDTGANVLSGGDGNDTVSGGDSDDTLIGGIGTDKLAGDAGHDTLKWDGADTFDGGTGFDTLDANLSSAETIDLRNANYANLERILTGAGDDTVSLSLNEVLSGTADHQFVADLGDDSDTLILDLNGGWVVTAPDPSLGPTGVAAGISVAGLTAYTFTNGADSVTVFTNAETVQQVAALQPLFTTGIDVVDFNTTVAGSYLPGTQYDALGGNDEVTLPNDAAAAAAAGYTVGQPFSGGDGNDTINGSGLDDTADGGNNDDTLIGGSGNDTITGGKGRDSLEGQAGNDSLFTANDLKIDTLVGGSGADTEERDPNDVSSSIP